MTSQNDTILVYWLPLVAIFPLFWFFIPYSFSLFSSPNPFFSYLFTLFVNKFYTFNHLFSRFPHIYSSLLSHHIEIKQGLFLNPSSLTTLSTLPRSNSTSPISCYSCVTLPSSHSHHTWNETHHLLITIPLHTAARLFLTHIIRHTKLDIREIGEKI